MPAVLLEASNILLACVLLWAGAAKLGSPSGASEALTSFVHIRQSLSVPAAMGLGAVEVLTAILLVTPAPMRVGPAMSLLLGAAFSLAAVVALVSRREIACGCFGSGGTRPIGWRNLFAGLLISGVSVLDLLSRDPTANLRLEPLLKLCLACCAALLCSFAKHGSLLRRPLADFALRGA